MQRAAQQIARSTFYQTKGFILPQPVSKQRQSDTSTAATTVCTPSTLQRDRQSLRLPSGQVIGFAEYGSPLGKPLIWCHGLPTSRGEVAEWDGLGNRLNARFIGIDRPGIGLSTFKPDRTILDHATDVRALARHLALERYSVMGSSGGGPYALACAHSIPKEELQSVGVMAGLGPLTETGTKGMSPTLRLGWYINSRTLSVLRLVSDLSIVPAAQNPDAEVFAQLMDKIFSKPEGMKKQWNEDETREEAEKVRLATEASREHFRQGSTGYLQDTKLLTQHWGFDLRDVAHPRVRLYYGTEDVHTPLRMGKFQAERLPHGTLVEFPGESHMTIMDRGEEIVKDLLEID